MPPERRRRGDVIAIAVITVVLLVAGGLIWANSPVANTASREAATLVVAPPPWTGLAPAAFREAWQAPSGATPAPVVAGPAVVTADGSTVAGRDARSGAEAWDYRRNLPLCTVTSAFPSSDKGGGQLLALFDNGNGWCSELTALRPDTGARVGARNPDLRPGTRLLSNGSLVAGTGATYLEVFRNDLVQTLEYGDIVTPVEHDKQPHSDCTNASIVLGTERLAVVQRCPDDPDDQLRSVNPAGKEDETPEERYTVDLPSNSATVLVATPKRTVVAVPEPSRLIVFDDAGIEVATVPVDVPATDLPPVPPGRTPAVETDGERFYWWSGSRTVALDAAELTPVWTVPETLGPAVPYGDSLLVPVPDGLAELDRASGNVLRTIPVTRPAGTNSVRLAVLGDVLLEQRGPVLAALVPA
ncbi:PQQ-binding-like beta-propeller repeat protein [Actinomycetes bacterium KLBMP 9759]